MSEQTMNQNLWIVRTPRGKKVIDINPEKHKVIMGRLHDAKTYKVISGGLSRSPFSRRRPRCGSRV